MREKNLSCVRKNLVVCEKKKFKLSVVRKNILVVKEKILDE